MGTTGIDGTGDEDFASWCARWSPDDPDPIATYLAQRMRDALQPDAPTEALESPQIDADEPDDPPFVLERSPLESP